MKKAEVDVIIPDMHLSPNMDGMVSIDGHDIDAVSIAVQIVADLKPKRVVQLGDMIDFGAISPFAKNSDMLGTIKSDDGRSFRATMNDYFRLGNRFLDILNEASKDSEIVLLEGNHERWLTTSANSHIYKPFSGDWNIIERLSLDERKIDWYPYGGQTHVFRGGKRIPKDNYYKLGKLSIAHGVYTGRTALHRHYNEIFRSSFIIGHLHAYMMQSFSYAREYHIGCCAGTLSKTTPSYLKGMANSWHQAIVVVYVHENGDFFLNPVQIVNGKASFNGKIYTPKPLKGLE
jgi:hypothetical protein